jgi:hypothetical protein
VSDEQENIELEAEEGADEDVDAHFKQVGVKPPPGDTDDDVEAHMKAIGRDEGDDFKSVGKNDGDDFKSVG